MTRTECTTKAIQLSLYAANRSRFKPCLPSDITEATIAKSVELHVLETDYLEAARANVAARAATAPASPEDFLAWFEDLGASGPGQGDPLFPWLANEATLGEMRWFLAQETAGEAGFEDLVAMTQVQMGTRAKLEMARNYWDEMGRGREPGMHGPMLERLGRDLSLHELMDEPVWESLALANLMTGLAANRCYAYQSVGALGVIELTAPDRAACVNEGLQRLGVAAHVRQYFALHATLDRKHAAAWNVEVLAPLVAEDPRRAIALAEGALMRLDAGARTFARYRDAFGTSSPMKSGTWSMPERPAYTPPAAILRDVTLL